MNNLNKNILLGTAIGDALGVPVEFELRQELEKEVSSLTYRYPRSILACIALCEFSIQYINLQTIEKAYQAIPQIILQFLK